jgi:hypothetical protein
MPETRDTAGAARRTPRGNASQRTGADPQRLEERTRLELYELAKELGIAGRGDMTKSELVEAIRRR